ncbi:MAG TPA: ABC transporter ATP-binding protein [Thermoanaerobaculia bacterium]|nr:ABC transporter ATP-binding protein [Thermoanaerobaculia bacterium]
MNAIELSEVTVRYPMYRVPSLKEWVIRGITSKRQKEFFYALRDVSFAVEAGDSIGLIGPNGAGKSTMMRVAAGIISPSSGYALVRGSVAPLIELGTGFDPELTGRENIFFNGALLGRSRARMKSSLDEIIDFSGLSESIDQPVRTYSSGMVARLAFSIATAIEADVVLLDEILSVGDASFRTRCQERIKGFYHSGATVMLVSHQMETIMELCKTAIWIDHGVIMAAGPTGEVVQKYSIWVHSGTGDAEPAPPEPLVPLVQGV